MNDHLLRCAEFGETPVIPRYLGGLLSESDAEAFEAHLLTCARCQEELRLAVAIRNGLEEFRDDAFVTARRRRRVSLVLGPALAAAAMIAAVLVLPRSHPTPTHRGSDVAAQNGPALVAPVGRVESVDRLTWRRAPGADRYRLVILDAEGSVIWEDQTSDSTAVIPGTIDLEAGQTYYWKVDARIGIDRWIASELASFSFGSDEPAERR